MTVHRCAKFRSCKHITSQNGLQLRSQATVLLNRNEKELFEMHTEASVDDCTATWQLNVAVESHVTKAPLSTPSAFKLLVGRHEQHPAHTNVV